ncbi:hypothetical protein ANAPH2_01168 [Anaplasma phagocytophilum]|nr:hypothetical protein ANAPH2_00570 [Anaplasma phagocytophilum]SCV65134.1 hypothetical protein ANAPH2_01168 [Anaplasma phagocytophilum]
MTFRDSLKWSRVPWLEMTGEVAIVYRNQVISRYSLDDTKYYGREKLVKLFLYQSPRNLQSPRRMIQSAIDAKNK